MPTDGGEGVTGCDGITTLAESPEVQPAWLDTVKLYVPELSPETVELVPVPVDVMVPGYPVSVQVPVAGSPLNITLPVASAHVGAVIVPTDGGGGVVFGAAVPLPGKLIQPLTVVVTV